MSVTLTSEDGKENEHDGIEEAKAHGQGVLVDEGRDDEHGEHGSCSEFPFRQLRGSEQEQRGFGSKFRGQAGSLGNLCHKNYRMIQTSGGKNPSGTSQHCFIKYAVLTLCSPRGSLCIRSNRASHEPPRSRSGNSWRKM